MVEYVKTEARHPDQIVSLAEAAMGHEPEPADASAILLDAAAYCAVMCGLSIEDMVARLHRSRAVLQSAKEAVDRYGEAAARNQ